LAQLRTFTPAMGCPESASTTRKCIGRAAGALVSRALVDCDRAAAMKPKKAQAQMTGPAGDFDRLRDMQFAS
jgi:hypothetical protein